jgi:accessory gene regulator protein AgrB
LIDKIATWIGKILSDYTGLNEVKQIELIYFLKRIIKNLIFYIITFNIAILLNIFNPVLILLLSYHCVRLRFGGIHLKNQTLCLIISIIAPLGLGYIASNYKFNLLFMVILYAVMILYANYIDVIDNINRPLTVDKKLKFKKQGLITMTILFVLNIIIYILDFVLISNSILMGVLLGVILLIRFPIK